MRKIIQKNRPWFWISSLYLAEGLPYVVVMTVSVIMYKRLGISNSMIALYTSWLYLPWVIKPLWGPVVDLVRTKRFWIITTEFILTVCFLAVAVVLPMKNFFIISIVFLWFLAFFSATQDIAIDGFYMLSLDKKQQAFFVGIRSTFYRIAMLAGQGLLIILAGYFEMSYGRKPLTFEVNAVRTENIEYGFFPGQKSDFSDNWEKGIFLINKDVKIPLADSNAPHESDLLKKAHDWNISHGFYEGKEQIDKLEDGSEDGLLMRIEQQISVLFGEKDNQEPLDIRKKIGVAYVYLNDQLDENQEEVFHIARKSGSKNISIKEGQVLRFTKENIKQYACIIFQLDPKTKSPQKTSFTIRSGKVPLAWTMIFVFLALLFFFFSFYHFRLLPGPQADRSQHKVFRALFADILNSFSSYFQKKGVVVSLLFFLFYRLGESQLVKLATPFMLDFRPIGGLGLTTGDIGLIYGTFGTLALIIGGILGGIAISKRNLKYWIWWMAIAMNLPNLMYVYLSYAQPESYFLIGIVVLIEQFGYGFGFAAYMMYMIYFSDGPYKTSHFAISTGFMALGMMLPGMMSGWLQELIGYRHFFVWVVICSIPGLLCIKYLPLDIDKS